MWCHTCITVTELTIRQIALRIPMKSFYILDNYSHSKRMFCKKHRIPKSTLDCWLHKYSNGPLFSEKTAGRPITNLGVFIHRLCGKYDHLYLFI